MRATITLAAAAALLTSCSTAPAEPDANSTLIAKRYADCVPGLKAADIQRVSDTRYTWSDPDGKWVLAWNIGGTNAETGQPFTPPAEDALPQFTKLGCV
jgi:hypothetical protein